MILLTWAIYYIIILLFPMLIGSIVYSKTIQMVNTQVAEINSNSLDQVGNLIDQKISEIDSIGNDILLNEKVKSLIYRRTPVDSDTLYTLFQIRKDFQNYKLSNSYINCISLYYRPLQCMITDSVEAENSEIQNIVENDLSLNYTDWQNAASKYNADRYLFSKNREKADNLVYFKTISFPDRNSAPKATLIISINLNKLRSMVQQLKWTSKGNVILEQKGGGSISLGSGKNMTTGLPYDRLTELKKISNEVINGQKVIITQAASSIADWQYESIMPSEVYLEEVRQIKTIFILYVVVWFTVGIVLIFLLLKKSYKPLGHLIDVVTGKIDRPPEVKNAFSFLENSIHEIVDQRDDLRQKLDEQNTAMFDNIFSSLLKGRCSDENCSTLMESQYGLHFDGNLFTVIVITTNRIGSDRQTSEGSSGKEITDSADRTIRTIAKTWINKEFNGCVGSVDGMIGCIVNMKKVRDESTAEDRLMRVARSIRDEISETAGLDVSICISKPHSDFINVSKGYTEDLEILEYKILMNDDRDIFYYGYFDESAVSLGKRTSMPSFDKERNLIQFISDGDYKDANGMIDEIFKDYVPANLCSLQIAKCRIFGLVNLILNALLDVRSNIDVDFLENLLPVQRLLNAKSINELQREIKYIFNSILHHYDENKNNLKGKVDKIEDYIQRHYYDPELNEGLLSEKFDISVSYLSRIFKSYKGIGLLDYNHKTRLSQAKTLLATTHLSIKEISENVGYFNSSAFIRTFKRYEGVTPGQYKEKT